MIKKEKLRKNVEAKESQFTNVLQKIVDELNQGQRKKLVKNEDIKEIFDFYGVKY